ncbi:hypothetical protein [Maribacter hydrothermalis]|uniref:Threonine synthase n=1 Tax=Maribacter hydrothermalis TaxID=1836467 RepID=A0A1B7ZDF7_9FLAO|nr:hypothetical protein [Maribacter hydrothermalis]APQ18423.1 hypothetical protein BTR34_14355 [Maribacter hydrothermalis]OBR41370.1 hypothetical protein A9200_13740 [Maribacter hydrothermalis]
MNKFYLLGIAFALFSCKEAPKKKAVTDAVDEVITQVDLDKYPAELKKVFEAHGGLNIWKGYKTLNFEMPNEKFNEMQTIDLHKRFDKISAPDYTLGYDGAEVWLLDNTGNYEGKPKFYHNLMFYFFAMPFVFADDGIKYEEVDALVYDGVSYPGYRISYNSGVGSSSSDEYFIHYDAKNYEMRWLGYTMTYFSGEPSDKISWINYADWIKVDKVLLPKAITWHKVEEGEIKEAANTVSFENASLSTFAKPKGFYSKPKNAIIVE